MKNLIFACFIALLGICASCNNSDSKKQVQMVSAVQVYEAVYGEDSLQLVDVRTADEFEVSHLKNAQNICVTSNDFKEKVASLDKEKPVYVYCKKGEEALKRPQS